MSSRDRPRPGLSRVSPRPHMKALGTRLACLVLEDEPCEQKGSASHLRVRCKDCGWVYTFYTSKKVQHSFDINRRFVYAMRSIGQGHASMKRFAPT